MKPWLVPVSCALLLAGCALPTTTSGSGSATPATVAQSSPGAHGGDAGHVVLWYIPNRISDVLDIVRARLRLGPGLGFGARFTESASFDCGGYSSVFVGIPGPRRERKFNWPVGLETRTGGDIDMFDGSAWSGEPPHYGELEVGIGTQLVILGADLGVDVYEVWDFITGIVCVDPIGDDI